MKEILINGYAQSPAAMWLLLGGFLFTMYLTINAGWAILRRMWGWVDDEPVYDRMAWTTWLHKTIHGHLPYNGWRDELDVWCGAHTLPLVVIFFGPVFVYSVITYYCFWIWVAILALIPPIIRNFRRLKKAKKWKVEK